MPWRIRGVGGGVLARVHFYLERDGDIERLIADEREREEQKLWKETNSVIVIILSSLCMQRYEKLKDTIV